MEESAIHILLVEDDKAHAELIRRAFADTAHAGWVRLTVAGSLAEARACQAEDSPNLVITDLLLPDGQGTDLLPVEGEQHPYPVVIMTSFGNEQVAVEAMRAGALDYVVKSASALADMPHTAERALREWGHIRARQQSEAALRESEEKLRSIIEHTSEGIVLADEAGTIIQWNHGLERITGLGRDEALGRPLWDVQFETFPEERRTPEAYERLRAMLLELLSAGQAPWLDQYENAKIQHTDGRRRMVHTSVFVIQTDRGYRLGSTLRDVTDRVQAAAEREKLIAELEQALARIKTLRGLIPICVSCKKIRDDEGFWNQVEEYIEQHSEAEFTHGICPECATKLYPELYGPGKQEGRAKAGKT